MRLENAHRGIVNDIRSTADVNARLDTTEHEFLWTAGADKQVKVWNVRTGLLIKSLPGPTSKALRLEVVGESVWASDFDGNIIAYDANKMTPSQVSENLADLLSSLVTCVLLVAVVPSFAQVCVSGSVSLPNADCFLCSSNCSSARTHTHTHTQSLSVHWSQALLLPLLLLLLSLLFFFFFLGVYVCASFFFFTFSYIPSLSNSLPRTPTFPTGNPRTPQGRSALTVLGGESSPRSLRGVRQQRRSAQRVESLWCTALVAFHSSDGVWPQAAAHLTKLVRGSLSRPDRSLLRGALPSL
jgi:WD40 repeat protein